MAGRGRTARIVSRSPHPSSLKRYADSSPLAKVWSGIVSPAAGWIRQRGTSVTLKTRFEAVVWVSGSCVFPTVEMIPP